MTSSALFPDWSDTLYFIVYVPTVDKVTISPEITMSDDIFLFIIGSVAIAPSSSYISEL